MSRQWAGPLVTILIGGGVALILVWNLNLGPPRPLSTEGQHGAAPSTPAAALKPAGFREYPIGDEVQENHMRIAAVWLPPMAAQWSTRESSCRWSPVTACTTAPV